MTKGKSANFCPLFFGFKTLAVSLSQGSGWYRLPSAVVVMRKTAESIADATILSIAYVTFFGGYNVNLRKNSTCTQIPPPSIRQLGNCVPAYTASTEALIR